MIVCVAEDRTAFEPAIKLLLMSLSRHCGAVEVHLFHPNSSNEFLNWLSKQPQVHHHTAPLPSAHEFNVKPQAMLALLERGHDDIIWIDSDIIINGDISTLFSALDYNTLAITEEALWTPHDDTHAWRAQSWGFEVGRILPFALNSGVVRVTGAHRGLLQRWQDLLGSAVYRDAQRMHWRRRPLHMVSDQDALTALLASGEFAHVPLKILRRGGDIIQYFGPYGYTLRERWSHTFGVRPLFVHSQGPDKPWTSSWRRPTPRYLKQYFHSVYLDVSPYTLIASSYADRMEDDVSWMRAHSLLAAMLRTIGLRQPSLVGLPLAAIADLYRTTIHHPESDTSAS
jgi:hypothetical protein